MRKEKTIELRTDLRVTVLELTPRDLKNAIGLLQKGDIDFERLLLQDWDDAVAKLSGVIRADGAALEDLSFSEIAEVKDAFMEVNAAFFDLLGGLGLNLAVAGQNTSATSISPASP